jgi:hypothetical protein
VRGFGEPVDDERRALLIRLHGEAETVPAFERRIGEYAADDVEREFEPVGFFGVDGHADAVLHRELREREDFRRELGVHAFALGDFVARMQRGSLTEIEGASSTSFSRCFSAGLRAPSALIAST